MSDLISRCELFNRLAPVQTLGEAYGVIQGMDTVDAVPVRHGRWETDGMMMDDGEYLMTRCTACGEAYEYGFNMPFCPNCGARMDGKGNGNG